MKNINSTEFEVPEYVVLKFIKCSYQFCKRCPIGPKGSREECIKESLKLIHDFTYLKFHPNNDYRLGLDSIKDIKEIDFTETINKEEVIVVTKKNQSIVPSCEFKLKLKNKEWRISNVRIKQGKNNYHTIL